MLCLVFSCLHFAHCLPPQVKCDSAMMVHVPALKRSLEAIVLAFKAVMAQNNLAGFSIGALKHRALDGTVVCESRSGPWLSFLLLLLLPLLSLSLLSLSLLL